MEKKIAEWKTDFIRYCRAQKKAESTIKVYWCAVECFIRYFNTVSLDRFHWHKIADYILRYDSARTIDQKKFAIQLFYGVCLNQHGKLSKMPTSKPQHMIPQVMNVDEIGRVIMCAGSWSKSEYIQIKQRLVIQFPYDCALRISEVINAKIKHIDLDRNSFFIYQSKGAKDRMVFFTNGTKNIILKYLVLRFPDGYTGEEYLFDGQDNFFGKKCEQYSEGSLRAVLRKAVKKAGVMKKIKFHSLRHSKATHLHNSGIMTLRDLADFLGHVRTETTEIYLHTQNEDLRDKVLRASQINKERFSASYILPQTFSKLNNSPTHQLYL